MKVTTREMIITPEIAMRILQTNQRNRTMDKRLILAYADQMNRGLWKFNGESIIISDENILLDGQHRLGAIIKSNTAQKTIVVEGVPQASFDTIDTGKGRTAGDILSIADIKNSTVIASIITKYFTIASKNASDRRGLTSMKVSKQEVLATYQSAPDFWKDIYINSSKFYRKIRLLSNSEIGGYMSYLAKDKGHNLDLVVSFFNQLFFDTDIENATIPLLREKLLRSITTQYKTPKRVEHALIVKTWNAYVSGKEYKTLPFNAEKEQVPDFL